MTTPLRCGRRGAGAVRGLALAAFGLITSAAPAVAQTVVPPAEDSAAALVAREEEIRDQFRDLERTFLRLADLLAASDPRRSALLRTAFEQAREAEVSDRLDAIVAMLEKGQLLKAGTSQATAIEKLRELLVVLEAGDTDRRLANTKEEVRQFLARLGKVIARQRDVEGSTEAGGEAAKLAERQAALARETEALARDIGGFAKRLAPADAANGKPSSDRAEGEQDGDPPTDPPGTDGEEAAGEEGKAGSKSASGKKSAGGKPAGGQEGKSDGEGESSAEDPQSGGEEQGPDGDDEASRAQRTQRRLQAAEQRMRQAQDKLAEAKRRDARQDQEKAVEELETARAELEEILRQLREEEVERVLVQLGARLKTMLRIEKGVLAGAEKLAAAGDRARPGRADAEGAGPVPGERERQLEATRLAREQNQVAAEATRALALVRDDGSAVAIPEALAQLHDDAQQAAGRLVRGDVGATSRGIMQDIVANLEEMIAALEKAQREQQAKAAGESGGRPAQAGEQPLVDKLAELKMIRSLQMRVNTRTGRFARLLAGDVEQAEEPELLEAVRRLAERQRTIERAAHDIVTGRTE
ncbi:MAG: hypothetical protein EBR86_03090 [Planctomycetia bacterium]|nr:hypothetical protein [Planctomycetia bacterium]